MTERKDDLEARLRDLCKAAERLLDLKARDDPGLSMELHASRNNERVECGGGSCWHVGDGGADDYIDVTCSECGRTVPARKKAVLLDGSVVVRWRTPRHSAPPQDAGG